MDCGLVQILESRSGNPEKGDEEENPADDIQDTCRRYLRANVRGRAAVAEFCHDRVSLPAGKVGRDSARADELTIDVDVRIRIRRGDDDGLGR